MALSYQGAERLKIGGRNPFQHTPNVRLVMRGAILMTAFLVRKDAPIKTIQDIRGKGWEIGDKKQGGDQSWQAWMKDPDGLPIEVMQYTPESSQFTGKPCIVTW